MKTKASDRRNPWKKWLKWGLLLLGILSGAALLAIHHFLDFRLSEEEIAQRFAASNTVPRTYMVDGFNVVETGNPEGIVLMFLHGSPGGWDNYIPYLADADLQQDFRMLAMDRPGYQPGSARQPEPSLARQADAVATVLKSTGPAYVIGHSMGGPIAVRLAVDSPDQVLGLLLLSAALDPDLEQVTWYQRVAAWPWVEVLLPQDLRVCNQELIPLGGELTALESEWDQVQVPVLALHGMEDRLVPIENMDFLEQKRPPSQLEIRKLEGEDHFIPWTAKEAIVTAIRDLTLSRP